jgi:hypothetical protein
MFVATAHSGHSLIGSLLDAHPSIIVANEGDVFGKTSLKTPRSELFRHIYKNSLSCALFSRIQHGYNYTVPHQANGQFLPGKLLAIGDKKGGVAASELNKWIRAGTLKETWEKWEAHITLPIKVIHVWWANQWSEQTTVRNRHLVNAIVNAGNDTTAFEFNNSAFIANPASTIDQLCTFLNVPCTLATQRSWERMVNAQLSK